MHAKCLHRTEITGKAMNFFNKFNVVQNENVTVQ